MRRNRRESIADWRDRTEMQAARREASVNYVYRAFDSYGLLLYVGCSIDVAKRLTSHRSASQWYRFAETVGSTPHESRSGALAAEKHAIDTEGAYFNSSSLDIARTQANLNAAKRSLRRRGWVEPDIDADPCDEQAWEAAYAIYEPLREAWARALEKERARLKAGAYPFLTEQDKLERYLAARADAELARQEAAA